MIVRESTQATSHTMIWMHGLGAGADDMIGVVDALAIEQLPIKHIFLQAPDRPVTINGGWVMPAWYDIIGADLQHRQDKQGLEESKALLVDVIEQEERAGRATNKIIIAGFSQGGALSLYTGIAYPKPLAGIVALSAYLPLANQFNAEGVTANADTPMFLAAGTLDDVVKRQWSEQSSQRLQSLSMTNIEFHCYPMGHSICPQEILDLRAWISKQIVL